MMKKKKKRVLVCARTHHWYWGRGGGYFSFYSVQDCNLGQNKWKIWVPPPPISMMKKKKPVLVCARTHHWYGGRGGGVISHFILSKIVDTYCCLACDNMATMLVVKNNSLSPLGTKLYFYANYVKKKFEVCWPPTWPTFHVGENQEYYVYKFQHKQLLRRKKSVCDFLALTGFTFNSTGLNFSIIFIHF